MEDGSRRNDRRHIIGVRIGADPTEIEAIDATQNLRSRAAVAMRATLKQLGSDSVGVSLPTIGESLAAVRAYKPVRRQAGQ